MDVDEPRVARPAVAPDALEQRRAVERDAGVVGELDEQAVLGRRQRDLVAVATDDVAGAVDRDRADADDVVGRAGGAAAERRSAARTRAASTAGSNGFVT